MYSVPALVWFVVTAYAIGMVVLPGVALARTGAGRTGVVVSAALGVAVVVNAAPAWRGAYEQPGPDAFPWIGLPLFAMLALLLAGTRHPTLRRALDQPATLRWLTLPQTLRVGGFVFVLLVFTGDLPAVFGITAGVGDMLVGVWAITLVVRSAKRPVEPRSLLWFTIAGLVDLVAAVSIGITTSPGLLNVIQASPTTAAMTLLPLAVIPTVGVPIMASLHLVSLSRLRRRSHASQVLGGESRRAAPTTATTAPLRRTALAATGVAILLLGTAACGNTSAGSTATADQPPQSAVSSQASAEPVDFMVATSPMPYQETLSALRSSVAKLKLAISGEMDYAQALPATGPQEGRGHMFLVWGTGFVKTLIENEPAASAGMPVRMYIWPRSASQTYIGYYDPSGLLTGINPKLADAGVKISRAAALIIRTATGTMPARRATATARFVTVESERSFEDTTAALRRQLSDTGLSVGLLIDQKRILTKAAQARIGGSQTYLGWNPDTARRDFQLDPMAGAVLPLRFHVWQDATGKTLIGYFDPAELLAPVSPKLAAATGRQLSQLSAELARGAA